MRGYELALPRPANAALTFRIPMRGYEGVNIRRWSGGNHVPNPHEGL